MKRRISIIAIVFAVMIVLFAQDIDQTTLDRLEQGVTDASRISPHGDRVFPQIVFQSADIKAVINFFAETGDVNIIVDSRITGTVDLKLRDVTWATAFQSIINSFNLTLIQEGNTYRAMRLSDYRKDIIDERDFHREAQRLIPRDTRVFMLSNADANAMAEVLQGALTDGGRLVIDGRTNSVIVNDIPETFARIEELISRLDVETPQIRVSARILSVDKEHLNALGVSWEIGAGISQGIATQNRTGNIPPHDQYVSLGVRGQELGVVDQLGSFRWGIVSGDYDIGASIAALTSNNKGKIVDSPEIVTVDNVEAEIMSGVSIPINTVDEAGNVVTVFYDVGVSLKVKPHITSVGRVSLDLHIERNSYQPAATGYSIVSRWARTSVIVDDGGALIIGGLTTHDTKNVERGVPVLKDLPLIGRLFRYESESTSETELVIFVTPYTIIPDGVTVDFNYQNE
ncbi:MAG TPA: hypothetical protein ENN07_08030 [candidate division Zixibacteria bacterium]|nr:hypothetical protein [candidate division Zixibacteria bacterium]